jgi:hypothetical protein
MSHAGAQAAASAAQVAARPAALAAPVFVTYEARLNLVLGWPPPRGLTDEGRRAAKMKSVKRVAALLLAGFLAFAPPGTMIFLLALFVGLVGRRWAVPLIALCAAACAALLLVRLRRRRRARAEDAAHTDTH